MLGTRLLLTLACVATISAEVSAQVIPFPLPRPAPSPGRGAPRRFRPRYLYERSRISPWLGGDFGFAIVLADCSECTVPHDGLAGEGTIAAGVMLYSRFSIAAEQTGMNLLWSKYNTARLTMLTLRAGTTSGWFAKAGIGEGRFRRDPTLLVDDVGAWMLGIDNCALGRTDTCEFMDYSATRLGSPTAVNNDLVHYRMQTFRFGVALRFHIRRGQRTKRPV